LLFPIESATTFRRSRSSFAKIRSSTCGERHPPVGRDLPDHSGRRVAGRLGPEDKGFVISNGPSVGWTVTTGLLRGAAWETRGSAAIERDAKSTEATSRRRIPHFRVPLSVWRLISVGKGVRQLVASAALFDESPADQVAWAALSEGPIRVQPHSGMAWRALTGRLGVCLTG